MKEYKNEEESADLKRSRKTNERKKENTSPYLFNAQSGISFHSHLKSVQDANK